MARTKMSIASWWPYHHPTGVVDMGDGSFKQIREESHAVVEVFTYHGGFHGPPFTTLETYIGGRRYRTRLARAYHGKWFGRLANQFDHECWQDAKQRGNV